MDLLYETPKFVLDLKTVLNNYLHCKNTKYTDILFMYHLIDAMNDALKQISMKHTDVDDFIGIQMVNKYMYIVYFTNNQLMLVFTHNHVDNILFYKPYSITWKDSVYFIFQKNKYMIWSYLNKFSCCLGTNKKEYNLRF